MVEEAFRPGVVVTEAARRLGVHESLLYRWRGLMKASGTAVAEPSSFVAVTITPEPTVTEPPVLEPPEPLPPPASPTTSPAILEVILPSGARLRLEGPVDPVPAAAIGCLSCALAAATPWATVTGAVFAARHRDQRVRRVAHRADDGRGGTTPSTHPRRRRAGARHRLQERPGEHHPRRARRGAGRHHAAQVERRQPGVDPRLRPDAQLRQPRRQPVHGRHPDQHLRRAVRRLRDRSRRLPLRGDLQGRQHAGRRGQFRHADRAQRRPLRQPRRWRKLRLPEGADEQRRRVRDLRLFRQPVGAARGRLPRSQRRPHGARQRQHRLPDRSGGRDALLRERQHLAPAPARRTDQERGVERAPVRRSGLREPGPAAQHRLPAHRQQDEAAFRDHRGGVRRLQPPPARRSPDLPLPRLHRERLWGLRPGDGRADPGRIPQPPRRRDDHHQRGARLQGVRECRQRREGSARLLDAGQGRELREPHRERRLRPAGGRGRRRGPASARPARGGEPAFAASPQAA